ncbi:MAG: iron-containing alcohol dehydrogenase [Desulfitobacterium hafniense]|nr:iron-containing alcohol dehydrogenase [Desulfitobacterium hafniense]
MKWFRVPRDIVFGWGSLEYLKGLKGSRAIIVTDPGLVAAGVVDQVAAYLKEAGLETTVFSECEPDPPRGVVEKGAQVMKEFGPDWIIGVGGGSAIDAAKVMWMFYEYPDMTWDQAFEIFNVPPLRNKAKFIAVATTSGTGSEVTCAAVITNKEVTPTFKQVVASFEITPDIAVTDPELASKMPPMVTAATGMDALVHAIESFTSIAASEVDKALDVRAIKLLFRSLPKAVADGRNQVAREDVSTASLMAAMAFTNSFLGIVHSLAHQLGTQYGLPHGMANSIMLPYVVRFNSVAAGELYEEIANELKLDYSNTRDAVTKFIEAIYQLQQDTGLPHTIKEAGVDEKAFEADLDNLAANAMNDICVFNNPRVPTIEDMKKLYRAAFNTMAQ